MDSSYLESDFDSDFESDSDLRANIEPPPSFNLLPLELSLELSFKTSTPCLKYNIETRIQAISFLELNILQFEIIAKTGISKAQIYKFRDKAILQSWDLKVLGIVEVYYIEDTLQSKRPKTL
jgi:hypothetical protein